MDQWFQSALRLHTHLTSEHWNGQGLVGPDPGVRFNYRIFRFVKSYLRQIAWNDHMYYLQAQGYWILGNWALFRLTGENKYRQIGIRCSEYVLEQQHDDGAWDYPNPEWKGRVATNEGTWAALGLLESYRQTDSSVFLEGVLNWHKFLIEVTGFQQIGNELAINYFANRRGARVPNNSITVLGFFAELADVTKDNRYAEPNVGLLNFIQRVQKPSGEFPYAVGNTADDYVQSHFQCYQYNAFECLNLIRYYEITGNSNVLPTITRSLSFLAEGLSEEGYAYYQCGQNKRTVTYHTAALGAALEKASQVGIADYGDLARQAYAYVLGLQRTDGGFIHSQRDYWLLTDQRSYPRYLAMILYHLLHIGLGTENGLRQPEQAATC